MPEKLQSECYRTIGGKRFINWCDILEPEHEAMAEACKLHKIPHRIFKHPDGFRRLFVREDKVHLLT